MNLKFNRLPAPYNQVKIVLYPSIRRNGEFELSCKLKHINTYNYFLVLIFYVLSLNFIK